MARRPPEAGPNRRPDQALRRTGAATAHGLDVDGAFHPLDEGGGAEALALEQHPGQRLEGGARQLGDAPLEGGGRPLAQRPPGLAEHLLGAFQLGVGRAARERVEPRARGADPRANPGPEPFARLGRERRPHHPPGLVRLAVNQLAACGRVGDLTDVDARAPAPARAGSPARRRPGS